jgi:lycopene cyclase domain-containing protein
VTYTVAAALGVLGALAVDLFVLRTRLVAGAVFWVTYAIVLAAQLVSNGILTGRRVVRYDPHAILGPRLGHAPVEDLGFGFALVLSVLSLWVWLGRRGVDGSGADGPTTPPARRPRRGRETPRTAWSSRRTRDRRAGRARTAR